MKVTKSLKSQGSQLSKSSEQIEILEKSISSIKSFKESMGSCGLHPLKPKPLEVLQINLGYMCNQVCAHCHVDAGPDRKEIMTKETMNFCLKAIENSNVHTVDLTGGAPEMNPHFCWFVEELSKRSVKVIVRSNLTILVANKRFKEYPSFFKKHKLTVVASLPCYTESNVDKQRGEGVFLDSIQALKKLNELGYGVPASGLVLNLVFNPGGPSLPPDQQQLEADYKSRLLKDFGIRFNQLFTITNLPISRFLEYLLALGKYDEYMTKLVNAFNPSAADGVMCRSTLSVGWNGKLFDCDFNQMLEIGIESENIDTIQDFNDAYLQGRNIAVNQHCYGCTAGAGSSCQGSLV